MKMADFINFEAGVEEVDFVNSGHDDEVSNISDLDSLKSFIDNEELKTDVNFIIILIMLKLILSKHQRTHIMRLFMMLKNLMRYQIYVKVLKLNLQLMILKIPKKI